MGFFHRHRGSTPYLLLAPGLLFLAVFFLVPLGFLAYQSLQSGTIDFGYSFTWQWSNFSDAISNYKPQFIRSFVYAGIATLIALVISYPVAYWIAFRGGRWKNLLLLAIVAPFFVTYLIRTLAWETILADHGLVVNTLRDLHLLGILGDNGRILQTSTAVVAGITYNFLPFMRSSSWSSSTPLRRVATRWMRRCVSSPASSASRPRPPAARTRPKPMRTAHEPRRNDSSESSRRPASA